MLRVSPSNDSFDLKFDSTTSPWEDEETRQFYECFPDLKALVPSILYKDSEKVTVAPVAEPLEGKSP